MIFVSDKSKTCMMQEKIKMVSVQKTSRHYISEMVVARFVVHEKPCDKLTSRQAWINLQNCLVHLLCYRKLKFHSNGKFITVARVISHSEVYDVVTYKTKAVIPETTNG